jgi:hypothetical protein
MVCLIARRVPARAVRAVAVVRAVVEEADRVVVAAAAPGVARGARVEVDATVFVAATTALRAYKDTRRNQPKTKRDLPPRRHD